MGTEKEKSDTGKNGPKAWLEFKEASAGNINPEMPEAIKAEAGRYYREGSRGILEACNEGMGENQGIVHITDMIREGKKVRMMGLAGSPLYIALHLHQYEEAEQILKSAPQTAEPGYVVQRFKVGFSSQKLDECRIEFLAAGEVYLEEILLTDMDMPDEMRIRLWNVWFQRNKEDHPNLFREGEGETEVPLLFREWPTRVKARRKFGDLQYIDDAWHDMKHSEEECGPYLKAAQADLEQFWKGLKGLYRLKVSDETLYAQHMDERMEAHLIVKFLHIMACMYSLEIMMTVKGPGPEHFNQLKLSVDGAEALRKLKRGLNRLGITYVSGDALWDAWMDYHYRLSSHFAAFWTVFLIWKSVFDGEIFITLDGLRRERSSMLLQGMLYDIEQPGYKQSRQSKMELIYYMDGLRWTMDEGQKWLEKLRRDAEKKILAVMDRELLLLVFEKNLFLPEDIDFLWDDCCEADLQLKPLLLMKKYGCV